MRALALACLGVLAGCPDRTIAAVDTHQSKEETLVVRVSPKHDLDILFVVDDSRSMLAEQDSVRANFPRFMAKLKTIEGGTPNLHVGVASTNLGTSGFADDARCAGEGDGGRLQNASAALSGRYIEDLDDPSNPDPMVRLTNYTGTLESVFSDIAGLGADGCGFEQQLLSAWTALGGGVPENAGFLRPEAYLAIVFLTDEDDCSAADPSLFDTSDASLGHNGFRCTEYGVRCDGRDLPRQPGSYENCQPRLGSFLEDPVEVAARVKGLKAQVKDIFVASISGDLAPFRVGEVTTTTGEHVVELAKSCGEVAGDSLSGAVPAVRMKDFLDEFPNRSTFESICQPDLGPALDQIADHLRIVLGAPCFLGRVNLTDLEPAAPGLQLECQVSDVIDPDTDEARETVVPRCRMASETEVAGDSPIPCWWASIDRARCDETETGLTIQVERRGDPAPPDTFMVARCATE
jgi:hypothetical protein